MKIVFAGTPEFAVVPLQHIIQAGHEIVGVLTQPDKPQGRKGILTPPPVKALAEERGIPVLQPARLREDFAGLKALEAELMVTCAYGQILTQEVLDLFPRGVWNIHASLLPRYRGAAPIARTVIDGETETGVTIMKTDIGLDTGDMLLARATPITERDTAATLAERLSRIGAELIVEALDIIGSGNMTLTKQTGESNVAKKVQRTEVDFSRPAREVSCLIRGLSPAPASFATVEGLTLNFYFAEEVPSDSDLPAGTVLEASPKTGLVVKCGDGAVRLSEIQPAGGKRMSDTAFLNGGKIKKGMRFERLS